MSDIGRVGECLSWVFGKQDPYRLRSLSLQLLDPPAQINLIRLRLKHTAIRDVHLVSELARIRVRFGMSSIRRVLYVCQSVVQTIETFHHRVHKVLPVLRSFRLQTLYPSPKLSLAAAYLGQRAEEGILRRAAPLQELRGGGAAGLSRQRDEQVLRADVLVLQPLRFGLRRVDNQLHARREPHVAAVRLRHAVEQLPRVGRDA